MYFSLDAAHTSGGHVNESIGSEVVATVADPGTRAPAHHPSIAHCPVDGVFKKNIGGEGEAGPPPPPRTPSPGGWGLMVAILCFPRALPLPLRQDARQHAQFVEEKMCGSHDLT